MSTPIFGERGLRVLALIWSKATLSETIRDVEAGAAVMITRYGRAVAALVSA